MVNFTLQEGPQFYNYSRRIKFSVSGFRIEGLPAYGLVSRPNPGSNLFQPSPFRFVAGTF